MAARPKTFPSLKYRQAIGLGLVLAFVLGPPDRLAAAGPIRGAAVARMARVRAAIVQEGSAWDRYFARALRMRRLDVQGPSAVRVLAAETDGRLPDCAFVDYLQWRRSLNPARFDRFHVQLGQMLQRDEIARATTPQVGGQVIGPVEPQQVPEPTAWLLFAAIVGVAWRVRESRRTVGGAVVSIEGRKA